MSPHADPVCITGMGCVSGAGLGLAANMEALKHGRRAPVPPALFPAERQYPVFTCPIPEEYALPGPPEPAEIKICSRTAHLALYAAREALDGAGLTTDELQSARVGVCLGTSVGTALEFFEYYKAHREGREEPLDVVHRYLISNPSLALSRFLRVRGPVQTVANACSSGADAIGFAAQWIRDGLCDIAICGGTDALAQVIYYGFASLQLLADEPCRPFDKNRKGLNLGEGAGIMVLESPARVRPEKALGRIRGYGTCTDAYHLTAPHPEGRGLSKALSQALEQAGASISDIAFINAHGTATSANDAAEGAFFRSHLPDIPFIATKGCTGHTLGAAGAIEAVFTLAHLRAGSLPASAGFAESDPAIGASPVAAPTALRSGMGLTQSLAFGGNNSILLLDAGGAA